MSYLDDLKKKGQQFVQNVQNAANTASNVYNAAKQGVQNVYNAATGNTQQPVTPQAQIPNTNPSPASQPQNPQPEINWAAEYDKAMAPQTTPTTSAQPGGQAAQPPTSAAAQSALGEGAGQWQAELDNVMAQIMGKGKFDYNMNGDAMYQQYADIYQNQANLGMQNAMAQAAALTGGYGSSYGQMVGQQAYAQQMQGLNDIGLELYDRAYAQDMAERSQLMDQYNMLAAREEQAYNRAYQEGRDKVADDQWNKQYNWQAEEFDKLYGEGGYYTTEANKDRQHQASQNQLNREHDVTMQNDQQSHQKEILKDEQTYNTAERVASQIYNDTVREDNQTHDEKMQNDAQTHQSEMATQEHNWQAEEFDKLYGYTDKNGNHVEGYYEKEANKDREQDQNQFNAMYGYTDESGVYHEGYNDRAREDEQKFQQGIHDALYGYTDENGVFHEGYYATEADKERTQDQKQFDSLYGYTDEKGNKVSGYYEDMADKEFNQMYGDLEYDEDGNIVGGGYYTKKDAQDQKNWDAAQEASKTTTKYEGEGDFNGKEVPKQLAGTNGLTTTNTNFFDDNGMFKSAAVVSAYGADGKSVDYAGNAITPSVGVGTMTYNVGGKEIKVQTGTSPYTNTVNPDAKRGVMANGYQPTHYGTQPVGDPVDGEYTVINGVEVDVYSVKKDGKNVKIAYDDANNKYIEIDSEDIEEGEPTNIPAPPPRPNNLSGGGGGGGKFVQTIKQ